MNIHIDEKSVNSDLPWVSLRAFPYTWVMNKRNDSGLVVLQCLMIPKALPSPVLMRQLWPPVCGNTL